MIRRSIPVLFLLVLLAACHPARRPGRGVPTRSVVVTAFAYNSTPAQTDERPNETAFGYRLRPGMKVLAVSRDLEELGLTMGTVVRIEGLDGEWTVLDRMHGRNVGAIDLYMGEDVAAARRWGRRQVTVSWTPKGGTK